MSELELGPIGLGTFPFSNVFSTVTQADAEQIVATFIEEGGRYIETAPVYPREDVDLGKILRSHDRSSFVLGTKCVTSANSQGEKVRSGQPKVIRQQCIDELARLGVDQLDLLQAHIPPDDVALEVTAAELARLKEEGLVREIGVSNVSLEQLKQFRQGGDVRIIQNRLSLLHRESLDPEFITYCTAHGITFNPYQVIERAQLTAPEAAAKRRAGDLRASKQEYSGAHAERINQWVADTLRPIASDAGLTLPQLSIGWVLAQPAVACAVVGATSPSQVRQNMAATRLPAGVVREVDSAFSDLEADLGCPVAEYRGL